MEHHSNIVPWQMLCEEKGAKLRVAPINDRGELLLDEFAKLLGPQDEARGRHARLERAGHRSIPLRRMIELAHGRNIPVLVDGAQAVPHMQVDVQALDCDFYAFSGHKVYGPTGIGVLYGKAALLEAMPPYQGGGDMISSVTFEKTLYNKLPYKFEAGTPDIVRRHRPGRGDRLRERASASKRSPRTSTICSRTPPKQFRRFPAFA